MSETNPKPFVFVLMPFKEEFSDIYELGIKETCKEAGVYCERVDEQIFDESILERIYNQISKADIIIAEMTGRNPNVFYETGYAHALNKRVILLTQNSADIPFDLSHYSCIIYDGKIISLKAQLTPRIKWCIENPKNSLTNIDINMQFYINEILLSDKPIIDVKFKPEPKSIYINFIFNLNMHNKSFITLEPSNYSLAIHTSNRFKLHGENVLSSTLTPDLKRINNLKQAPKLYPNGWHSIELYCLYEKEEILNLSHELVLRLYTEIGFKDYPFVLNLIPKET